jgi:DNA-binding transcriptional LysR family regulator
MTNMMIPHPRSSARPPELRDPGLNLGALALFVRVCESGSMTVAASGLGTTQSAGSRRIQQLERQLGVTLLDRDARPLRATAAGEVLLQHATRLLATAAETRAALAAAAENPMPQLRLGLVDSFAVTLGAELIKALGREVNDVRVWSGLSQQLAQGLQARELDLLVTADRLEEMTELRVQTLYREPFVLALPRSTGVDQNASLEQLAATLPLVRYSLRSVTGRQVERYLRSLRLTPPRRMEFDGSESVVAMVQEGLGWALTTPLCLLQGHTDLQRLRLRALPAGAPRRGLFLVSRADSPAPSHDRVARIVGRLLRRLLRTTLRTTVPMATSQIEIG